MNEVTPFQPRTGDPNGRRRQCVGLWLRLWAETKIRNSNDEITEEKCQAYEWDLRDIPIEKLERAFERADRECKYFPKPYEISGFVDLSEQRRTAYEKLKAQLDQAYRQGHPALKSLPSVVDESRFAPHGSRREQ